MDHWDTILSHLLSYIRSWAALYHPRMVVLYVFHLVCMMVDHDNSNRMPVLCGYIQRKDVRRHVSGLIGFYVFNFTCG